jgi:hypothetical protein
LRRRRGNLGELDDWRRRWFRRRSFRRLLFLRDMVEHEEAQQQQYEIAEGDRPRSSIIFDRDTLPRQRRQAQWYRRALLRLRRHAFLLLTN